MDFDFPPDTIFKDTSDQKPTWSAYRDAASFALLGADWAQTRSIAKNPDKWHETNPILGQHPSVGKVNNYFLASLIGYHAASNTLPPGLRELLQYGTLGVETQAVGRNRFKFGIGITF